MSGEDQRRSQIHELFKPGLTVNKEGVYTCVEQTPFGFVVFIFAAEEVRKILGGIIIDFLYRLRHGHTLHPDQIKAATGIDMDKEVEITLELDQAMADEYIRLVGSAMEYFKKYIGETLKDSVDQSIREPIFRALRERSGQGFYKFDAKESELINDIIKDQTKRLKKRLGARQQGGSTPRVWTVERKEEFLKLFMSKRNLIKKAKQTYRKNRENPRWPEMVKAAYPELPDDIIARLAGTGKDAEPKTLALEYAAKVFGVEFNDYLDKVLIDARKDR